MSGVGLRRVFPRNRKGLKVRTTPCSSGDDAARESVIIWSVWKANPSIFYWSLSLLSSPMTLQNKLRHQTIFHGIF